MWYTKLFQINGNLDINTSTSYIQIKIPTYLHRASNLLGREERSVEISGKPRPPTFSRDQPEILNSVDQVWILRIIAIFTITSCHQLPQIVIDCYWWWPSHFTSPHSLNCHNHDAHQTSHDKDYRDLQVNLTWSTDSLAPVTQYTLHYRKSQVVRMMPINI